MQVPDPNKTWDRSAPASLGRLTRGGTMCLRVVLSEELQPSQSTGSVEQCRTYLGTMLLPSISIAIPIPTRSAIITIPCLSCPTVPPHCCSWARSWHGRCTAAFEDLKRNKQVGPGQVRFLIYPPGNESISHRTEKSFKNNHHHLQKVPTKLWGEEKIS